MSRALVTGARGYAGAAIAHALAAAGWEVISAGRTCRYDLLMDFADPVSVMRAPLLAKPIDACIHVAAAHEVQCAADPLLAMTTNVAGTRALLEWCVAAGIRRFVYVSTFHVFGRNTGDLDEGTSPRPGSDYGLTHLLAEESVEMFAPRLVTCVLRPSNLLGAPREWESFNRWTLAPFDFCLQAQRTGKIVLRSSGTQIRNWVGLEALAGLALTAARAELEGLVHVCGADLSILELARAVATAWTALSGTAVELVVPATGVEQCEVTRTFVSTRTPRTGMPDVASFVRSLYDHLAGTEGMP